MTFDVQQDVSVLTPRQEGGVSSVTSCSPRKVKGLTSFILALQTQGAGDGSNDSWLHPVEGTGSATIRGPLTGCVQSESTALITEIVQDFNHIE